MSLQDSGQEIEYHETENEISLANGLDHIRLPFAYKLHILLSDMESNKCKNIISWVEDGNAFKIHDRERFEQVVQPHYFRQSKLSSFIRQCYMYGFLRVESGRSQGSYFHPDFCKMDQEKSLTIKRHQSRQNHHRKCTPSFKLFKVYPSVMDVTRTIQMSDTSKSPSKHIPSSNMVISRDPPEYASTILNIAQQREAFPFANSFGQLPEHQQRMFIEEILDASDNEYMFEPRPIEMMLCSSLSLPMSPTFFIL